MINHYIKDGIQWMEWWSMWDDPMYGRQPCQCLKKFIEPIEDEL